MQWPTLIQPSEKETHKEEQKNSIPIYRDVNFKEDMTIIKNEKKISSAGKKADAEL
jgi:hypothetical protein